MQEECYRRIRHMRINRFRVEIYPFWLFHTFSKSYEAVETTKNDMAWPRTDVAYSSRRKIRAGLFYHVEPRRPARVGTSIIDVLHCNISHRMQCMHCTHGDAMLTFWIEGAGGRGYDRDTRTQWPIGAVPNTRTGMHVYTAPIVSRGVVCEGHRTADCGDKHTVPTMPGSL